ncbi:MAG: M20/M25/M40 family metallo-hydrolase [Coriobacteriia bacterium]|nr:M20/M25/M40 family metallo-hydrolase [Coriobacteriia bacterium]
MSTERLLTTFIDLVRIDSPSGLEAALAGHCATELEHMGFSVRFDASAALTGSNTGNLIAELPGITPEAPVLLLSAHLDCVEPCRGVEPIVSDGVVFSAGDTVLGADDKAGIAAIFEGVRRTIESGTHRGDLRVVLTVAEECGLKGAKALDPVDAMADICLVLDADGEPGGIVVGAPTHYTFVATFAGTASHAGVAPEEGRSALLMAARAVSEMELGRLDSKTTANAGTVEGGTATNVVPARVTLTGECRSLDPDRVEDVRFSMDSAMRDAAHSVGGDVDIRWTKEYEAFHTPEDSPVIEVMSQACADAGLAPRLFTTGGGSDGSIFAERGMPTLVLSCGMSSVHSTEEQIRVDDLEALARLMHATIARLAGEPR